MLLFVSVNECHVVSPKFFNHKAFLRNLSTKSENIEIQTLQFGDFTSLIIEISASIKFRKLRKSTVNFPNPNMVYFYVQSIREREVFHKTVRVCHVNCKFKLGYTLGITVIFDILKDGNLMINILASSFVLAAETPSKSPYLNPSFLLIASLTFTTLSLNTEFPFAGLFICRL